MSSCMSVTLHVKRFWPPPQYQLVSSWERYCSCLEDRINAPVDSGLTRSGVKEAAHWSQLLQLQTWTGRQPFPFETSELWKVISFRNCSKRRGLDKMVFPQAEYRGLEMSVLHHSLGMSPCPPWDASVVDICALLMRCRLGLAALTFPYLQ